MVFDQKRDNGSCNLDSFMNKNYKGYSRVFVGGINHA